MLPSAPGSDPLSGAQFFVDGPAHGAAAGAIAQLLGANPRSYADDISWASFKASFSSGQFARELDSNPALAKQVGALEKIADEPEAQRLSAYSQGGSPKGIFDQAQKLFCHNLTADPGSIPIINTYFLHPLAGGCPTAGRLRARSGHFKSQVNAMAAATGRRPAVFLLEVDAIGSSRCISHHGGLHVWESLLRYEAKRMSSLPHTAVYIEAGYSDANGPRYTARVLNASGIRLTRGFFTNDTHLNWTINEIKWGEKVSARTHGAHFIVNTAQNGNGPLKNPHPVTQGVEDLCNPPGRALGPPPTTNTGFAHVDAYLWTSPPGNSGGKCHGGPASGTFWVARAVDLAEHANARLGPTYPSRPY